MKLNTLQIQVMLKQAITLFDASKNAVMITSIKDISGSVVVAQSDLTNKINALYLKDISVDELSEAVNSKSIREALPKLTLDEYMFLSTGITPMEALSNIAETFKRASDNSENIVTEETVLH